MSSVIAKFMESVEPGRVTDKGQCNDDDGMLDFRVVDSVRILDAKSLWHPHKPATTNGGSSKHESYYHATNKAYQDLMDVAARDGENRGVAT